MTGGGSKPRGGKMGTSIRASVSGEAVENSEKALAEFRDGLTAQHDYTEKQLDSLKAASQPRRQELDRLEELDKVMSLEEKDLERLAEGSKNLKEKASELQNKIENAGGEKLKNRKLQVEKIQSVLLL